MYRLSVTATTDASGDATVYLPAAADTLSAAVTGRVLCFIYSKTDFDNGVDITVTSEATGQAIVTLTNQNASGTFYPRVPVQDETGADATLDGTRKMREPVYLVNDRIKIVVAAGGNAKTGTFKSIVG